MKLTRAQRNYLKYYLNRIKNNPEFNDLSVIISSILADQTKDEKLSKEKMQGIDKQLEKLSNTETLLRIEAITIRGLCLYHGIGGKKDQNQGMEYYKIAVDQDFPESMVLFAEALEEGGTKKDLEKSFELYLKAAKKGSAVGYYKVGRCYTEGKGVLQDPKIANDFFKQAVHYGYTYAMNALAYNYEMGSGVEQDPKKAFELYSRAAELGDDYGATCVAFCYRDGIYVEKNNQQFISLLHKAATLGCERANTNLFAIYLEGRYGVAKDKITAFYFLQQCVSILEQNEIPIDFKNAYNLAHFGGFYLMGSGSVIARGYDKAFQYFQKARDFEPEATQKIGWMFQNGLVKGKGKDCEQAVEYYKKAAAKGEELSKTELIKLGCL